MNRFKDGQLVKYIGQPRKVLDEAHLSIGMVAMHLKYDEYYVDFSSTVSQVCHASELEDAEIKVGRDDI